jgi:hypothetical protein
MTVLDERLDSGYRSEGAVHDIDDKRHEVTVDWPVAIDHHGTDFAPGAFEAGWRSQKPPMCLEHNKEKVIGRAERTESLPDRHRIIARFSSFRHVPDAEAAWSNIADGNYSGASFHFVDGRCISHPQVRSAKRYLSARMLEFGPVVAPSCLTQFSGLRSAGSGAYVGSDLLDELEYQIDDARYRIIELRRAGKIPPGPDQLIASTLAHSGETLARVRGRGALLISGRRSIGSVEKELEARLFPRSGRH